MNAPRGQDVLDKISAAIRDEVDPDFEPTTCSPIPWQPAPVSPRRAALVSIAGLHLRGDARFRPDSQRYGDTSHRMVPAAAFAAELDLGPAYVDRRFIPLDVEVAFPLRAFESACDREGWDVAARHASLCGGIVRPLPGVAVSAAAIAPVFASDGVTGVVVVPSCPMCVQTACVLACALESAGLATVCTSHLPALSRRVGAPRVLETFMPFGAPCGDPGNAALHEAVLREALRLLVDAEEPAWTRESVHRFRQDA